MSRSALLLAAVALIGCSPSRDGPVAPVPEDLLIVPGSRVGNFAIGRDTLADILGQDTPEARERFVEQGVCFEFDRGVELTGVTVTSSIYATREGFRVGDLGVEIEGVLGAPSSRYLGVQGKGFEIPVLSYPGITFVLAEGRVRAIRVGKK